MSKIVLQYSIVNDTAADAAPVEANFTRIESHINQEVIEREGSVAMTGQLKLVGNPVAPEDAASKAYVDGLFIIGSIQLYGGSTDPAGGVWLLCDGRELESASYPSLFSVIGTSYGSGGAGRFNIPDMRGRMPIGSSGSDALGAAGGSRDAIVVAHTHTIDHTHAGGNTGTVSADHSHGVNINTGTESAFHTHGVPGTTGTGSGINADGYGEYHPAGGSMGQTFGQDQLHVHNVSGQTGGISANHTHTFNTPGFSGGSGSAGSAGSNANLPPYRAVNYLIKVR